MSKQNRMPGLRQKGGIWHIEKRCKYVKDGWLRESTGTSSRMALFRQNVAVSSAA